MYPYGNAHEKKLPDGHYAYECQHGDVECQGNFIEACIQKETNFRLLFEGIANLLQTANCC